MHGCERFRSKKMPHFFTRPLFFFSRFISLDTAQRRVFFTSWTLLPFFWLGLLLLKLPDFYNRLGAGAGKRRTQPMSLADIQALGAAVNMAARHTPFPATCLTRSLLTGWFLHRRGVASELRIGVRLTQGVLNAHAWVECNGIPVNDLPDIASQFSVFDKPLPVTRTLWLHTP
jgi:Transglutaminase-like superfamily